MECWPLLATPAAPPGPPRRRTEADGPAVARQLPLAGLQRHDGLCDARVPHLDAACTHSAPRVTHGATRGARASSPSDMPTTRRGRRGRARGRQPRTVSSSRHQLGGTVAQVHPAAPVHRVDDGLVALGAVQGRVRALQVVDGELPAVVAGGQVPVLQRGRAKRAALDSVRLFNLRACRVTGQAGRRRVGGGGRNRSGPNALQPGCGAHPREPAHRFHQAELAAVEFVDFDHPGGARIHAGHHKARRTGHPSRVEGRVREGLVDVLDQLGRVCRVHAALFDGGDRRVDGEGLGRARNKWGELAGFPRRTTQRAATTGKRSASIRRRGSRAGPRGGERGGGDARSALLPLPHPSAAVRRPPRGTC